MTKGKLDKREKSLYRRIAVWVSSRLRGSGRRVGDKLLVRVPSVHVTIMRSCSCLSISKETVVYDRQSLMDNSSDHVGLANSFPKTSLNIPNVSRFGGSYRSIFDSDSDNELFDKEVELAFHNDDGSMTNCIVEPNLCSGDLCQLLAVKNHVAKDGAWSIIESWQNFGIERTIEDHEIILDVHNELEKKEPVPGHHFIFRKDFRKYEFFASPLQFFPTEMVDLGDSDEILTESTVLAKVYALQNMLNNTDEVPQVFGHLWVKEPQKQVWRKAFFLLQKNKLLFSYKVQTVARFYRRKSKETLIKTDSSDVGDLEEFADMTQCDLYTTTNAKNHFKAPTEYGVVLRTTGFGPVESRMRCLACDSERVRLCWLTAMRVSKYGKRLKDNYRQHKQRQSETSSTYSNRSSSFDTLLSSHLSPSESIRWRVPMDFTGRPGRIVEDEQVAPHVAAAEGHNWKRRLLGSKCLLGQSAPTSSTPRSPKVFGIGQATTGLEAGIHMTQPWFHSGMSREEAAHLLTTSGLVDGAFVVRESRSKAGIYVLSYLYRGRVHHAQITQVMDQTRNTSCFSLDGGKTKFYDLLQLVEFYQLNSLSLPTQLTHYVMRPSTKPFMTMRSLASSF
ncbi:growth factor receptor-bound protein 14-like isoform X1 [Artemia franciscana]|uniref:Growth factor receptor-bound protein 14 n=1 Tax=Artemia franciscana TaxID=6661 RepID=A0AA88HNE0_ARTSF|nr:hypothetical protein QYM36_014473 [Artemia franciscana]